MGEEEAVRMDFRGRNTPLEALLTVIWEVHDGACGDGAHGSNSTKWHNIMTSLERAVFPCSRWPLPIALKNIHYSYEDVILSIKIICLMGLAEESYL